jgi:thiamine-phosphate pyrophosphorylase
MISTLHYITQPVPGKTSSELTEEVCSAGINWVQLRIKNSSYNEILEEAIKTEAICRKYHAKIIINDHVNVAKAIRADGVHLGKSDMDPLEARSILGKGVIIGGTANTFEDIKSLAAKGVDYIGLGPFRFTATKENLSPVLGLEGYQEIIAACKKENIHQPIIAIGGITVEDVKQLIHTGVYGIAVSSAINLHDNRMEAVKRFINKIKFATEHPTT